MSGEARFTAGPGQACSVTLEPLMSTVEIHSLRCRIEGQKLLNVKVYLTGIGNRAELLRAERFLPAETLNNGGLSETDLGRLAYSGMVYKYLGNGKAESGGTREGRRSEGRGAGRKSRCPGEKAPSRRVRSFRSRTRSRACASS